MFTKIMVALDTSEGCAHVFHQAVAIAQATGAELKLLSVLTPGSNSEIYFPDYAVATGYPLTMGDAQWQKYQQEHEAARTKGLKILSDLSQQAKDKGIQTEFVQVSGEPGRIICDRAKAENAHLIVVGSHAAKGSTSCCLAVLAATSCTAPSARS